MSRLTPADASSLLTLTSAPLAQFTISSSSIPGQSVVDGVGVGVDLTGNIYVSSTRDSQIGIYRRDGHLLGSFGRPGMDVGEFNSPAGLWIDGRNCLYVGDANNGRVQVFQLSKNSGAAKTTDFSPRE